MKSTWKECRDSFLPDSNRLHKTQATSWRQEANQDDLPVIPASAIAFADGLRRSSKDTSGKQVDEHTLDILDSTGAPTELPYDALIVGTGAVSARPRSTVSPNPTHAAPRTGFTYCTRWVTPSPSWSPWSNANLPPRSSSAPATSA